MQADYESPLALSVMIIVGILTLLTFLFFFTNGNDDDPD